MKLPLSRGLFATVDDDAGPEVTGHKWCANGDGYAVRRSGLRNVYLHRVIAGAPDGMEVDHANGDRLDNQRANLRVCTHARNTMNQRKRIQAVTSSRFKGVTWSRVARRWQAKISPGGKTTHLGYFGTETEAATAYNIAALREFGEFAALNDTGALPRTEKVWLSFDGQPRMW